MIQDQENKAAIIKPSLTCIISDYIFKVKVNSLSGVQSVNRLTSNGTLSTLLR